MVCDAICDTPFQCRMPSLIKFVERIASKGYKEEDAAMLKGYKTTAIISNLFGFFTVMPWSILPHLDICVAVGAFAGVCCHSSSLTHGLMAMAG